MSRELSESDRAAISTVGTAFHHEPTNASWEALYTAGMRAGIELAAQRCESEFYNEADLDAEVTAYNSACHDCAAAIRALLDAPPR